MKAKLYIKEIQYRLFFTSFSFFFNFAILSFSKDQLLFLLGQHQSGSFPHFITTNLPEVFVCLMKLSFSLAFYFTFPVLLLHLWFFFLPALYRHEYEKVKKLFFLSIIFYFLGSFLTYTFFLPYCWKFFSGFELTYENSAIGLQLESRLQDYITFFFEVFFSFTLVFYFSFFFTFFLLKFPPNLLVKGRKLLYFLSFLLATLVTPPDVFSQLLVASIFISLVEIFLFSSFLRAEYEKGE